VETTANKFFCSHFYAGPIVSSQEARRGQQTLPSRKTLTSNLSLTINIFLSFFTEISSHFELEIIIVQSIMELACDISCACINSFWLIHIRDRAFMGNS
jgi:hypothetical protein